MKRKKIIALLLALAVTFSASAFTAIAAEGEDEVDDDDKIVDANVGKDWDGFDPDAIPIQKGDVIVDDDNPESYVPTDLTIDDINRLFLGQGGDTAEIFLYINGSLVSFPDIQPQIINDRTMIPVRIVAEFLGATVNWDDSSQTVSISKDSTNITLQVNNQTAKLNGEDRTLDVPAMLINDRTMIPFRFIFEAYNMDVGYSEQVEGGVSYSIITANSK